MSITYSESERLFRLNAGAATLAFSIDDGLPVTRFWGSQLLRDADIPSISSVTGLRRRRREFSTPAMHSEYPGWCNALRGSVPALKVTFADGTRDIWLRYTDHTIDGDTLTLRLSDAMYGLTVTLNYRVYDDCGIITRTVKAKYPALLFENCAGGGMRTDLAMLRFAGRINRSDNQDPLDVRQIHEGFSYFMLPKLAGGGCHISNVYTNYHNNRVTPMKYQAETAMMGSLAIGENLTQLSAEARTELKGYIDTYKSLRHIVHLGDIYRLVSASEKPYAAFEYLYGDEGVLFVLGGSQQFMQLPEPIRLAGLSDTALYEIDDFGVLSGRALMRIGISIPLEGDFYSRVIRFRRVNA